MSFFIGIDGGGSKTKCVICDESLNILSKGLSGPSNFLTIGTSKVADTILHLIIDCCSKQNIPLSEINGIVLGTTGAGRESDASKLENKLLKLAGSKRIKLNAFKVVSDARIALEGAFTGKAGSILISGTGSIMFGKDKSGNIFRVGGLGRLIGDEGSGLTLGRKGLNILAKFYDGRIISTILKDKIESNFKITNQNELITKVYSKELEIQNIAPYVISSAEEGDEACKEILDKETDELILHIMAMDQKLNEENMKIVFIGGTITSENLYSKMLKKKIKLYFPKIIVQQPDYPPEIGAIILAKQ